MAVVIEVDNRIGAVLDPRDAVGSNLGRAGKPDPELL